MSIGDYLLIAGIFTFIVSQILTVHLYFIIRKRIKKIRDSPNINFNKLRHAINQFERGTVMKFAVLLLMIGFFLGGFSAKSIQYENTISVDILISDPVQATIYTIGKFELTCDGPLASNNPVKISKIQFYNIGDRRIDTIGFRLDNTEATPHGDVMVLNIPEEYWVDVHNLKIEPESHQDITYDRTPFKFNSNGIRNIEIWCWVNVSDEPYYSDYVPDVFVSTQKSSDFVVSPSSELNDYRNSQVQAAFLVFGVVVITIPVMFKTVIEIYEKWFKQSG